MSKKLVLAEKPSVGRDLARVLKCNKKGNGFIEGDKYIVTWALGHLVTLANPETYDEKYKVWNMEDLPMMPKYLKLVVIKQTSKQYSAVKSQLSRGDVDEIIIATDAGREGELVARWIIEKSGVKKPIKRLWISSVTDKAIKDGFNNLKDGKEYENLYKSAICRSEADWIVGLNVTRALTCRYNAQLSAGRVQTPTLAMIVQREEEIKNFKPKDYYNIIATAQGFKLKWSGEKGSNIFNKDVAQDLYNKLKGKAGKVKEVNKTDKKKYSPALYDLTELQRDANKIWGYSAKQTLSIMQRLYENHKILTYPRTDSRYITSDIIGTLPERLKAISLGSYSKYTAEILKNKITAHKGFVDNSKVSDHHAIIPTEETPKLSNLSHEERNIYDLVIKRFLSVMLPPYIYTQVTVNVEVEGEVLGAKGIINKSRGWKEVYIGEVELDEAEEGENQELPNINIGDDIRLSSIEMKKLQTKAPSRFNEATLLSAMENPHKYVNMDKSAAKTLGETGGLGTVATRADIIEKLFNSFYVEKRGKELVPTSKGKQLVELVPEDLRSPILTAQWERNLELISKGKLHDKSFLSNMRSYASELVKEVKESKEKFVHDNMTGKKCPDCGKYLLEVKGKHGIMNVCQDRDCGYREGISKFTNIRCPECHKKLELRGHGEGQIYVCPNCSFREKLTSFNNRFKEKNKELNKKEVNKYMKKMKQEAEEPMNNAFADLFSKLNLDKK